MPIFSAASRVSRRHTMRTTQENATAKHPSSGTTEVEDDDFRGMQRMCLRGRGNVLITVLESYIA